MKIFSKDTKEVINDYVQWFSLKNLFLSFLLGIFNIGMFFLLFELFLTIKYSL